MNLKSRLFFLSVLFILLSEFSLFGQKSNDNLNQNLLSKSGWRIAAIPNISFDSDVGFRYGGLALVNYNMNNSQENRPGHSFKMEWSRTNQGNGINRLNFNSIKLIPSLMATFDISYLMDLEMQFFGFNGYDAVYNQHWENKSSNDYISEMFYRHDRRIFKITTNFEGRLFPQRSDFLWFAGLDYFDFDIGTIDLNRINEKLSEQDKLNEVETLYDKYIDWGLINEREASGDNLTFLKGGIIYDTRDDLSFPTKGVFSEMIISYAPSLPGDGNLDFAKATVFWRQYLSIDSKNIVLAYRLGIQSTLFGEVPYYIQPYLISSDTDVSIFQGLGGAKTLRGVMRNRVVGEGIFLGNLELRWKFLRTSIFNQTLYLGANIFVDIGKVVNRKEIKIDESKVKPEDDLADFFDFDSETFHTSGGIGLKIGINESFIISTDYGITTDNRDGKSGVYMNLNWLF